MVWDRSTPELLTLAVVSGDLTSATEMYLLKRNQHHAFRNVFSYNGSSFSESTHSRTGVYGIAIVVRAVLSIDGGRDGTARRHQLR
jgi:hypothetical protein